MDIARPDISRKKRRQRIIAVGISVALLALITAGVSRLKPALPTVDGPVYTDTVKRGTMLREIRGNGTLVPVEIRWVPASSAGRIERILVEAGQQVKADTVLIELSDPTLEQDAASAQALLEVEEANLANLRVQVESQRLTQQSAVATAEANYNQARVDADVNAELGKSGLVPELVVNQAKAKADELHKLFEIEKERLEMTPQSAKAQVAAQDAKLKQLRTQCQLKRHQVDSLKVRAGIDGIVQRLGDTIPLQAGQQIPAGVNLARISNPTRLKAQIKIAETQTRDLAIGQPASIDTRNGLIPGHVTRVDPASENGTVTVDVALDGPLPRGARPDLSVDGTIQLDRLEDALNVGRPVNGQPESTVSLYKVIDGGKVALRVPVKLGRSSVSSIEILEGLQVGDQVVLSDMSQYDRYEQIRLK